MRSTYIPGDPYFICDICGWKIRSSQKMKTWEGFVVCPKDYDPKHEQLAPTPIFPGEGRPLKDSRPEPTDVFIGTNDIQPEDL